MVDLLPAERQRSGIRLLIESLFWIESPGAAGWLSPLCSIPYFAWRGVLATLVITPRRLLAAGKQKETMGRHLAEDGARVRQSFRVIGGYGEMDVDGKSIITCDSASIISPYKDYFPAS